MIPTYHLLEYGKKSQRDVRGSRDWQAATALGLPVMQITIDWSLPITPWIWLRCYFIIGTESLKSLFISLSNKVPFVMIKHFLVTVMRAPTSSNTEKSLYFVLFGKKMNGATSSAAMNKTHVGNCRFDFMNYSRRLNFNSLTVTCRCMKTKINML